MGIAIDINASTPVAKPNLPSIEAQEALFRQPLNITAKVPCEAKENTVINLGTSLFPALYPIQVPKGNYTLYKNSAGENLGLEAPIDNNSKIGHF